MFHKGLGIFLSHTGISLWKYQRDMRNDKKSRLRPWFMKTSLFGLALKHMITSHWSQWNLNTWLQLIMQGGCKLCENREGGGIGDGVRGSTGTWLRWSGQPAPGWEGGAWGFPLASGPIPATLIVLSAPRPDPEYWGSPSSPLHLGLHSGPTVATVQPLAPHSHFHIPPRRAYMSLHRGGTLVTTPGLQSLSPTLPLGHRV